MGDQDDTGAPQEQEPGRAESKWDLLVRLAVWVVGFFSDQAAARTEEALHRCPHRARVALLVSSLLVVAFCVADIPTRKMTGQSLLSLARELCQRKATLHTRPNGLPPPYSNLLLLLDPVPEDVKVEKLRFFLAGAELKKGELSIRRSGDDQRKVNVTVYRDASIWSEHRGRGVELTVKYSGEPFASATVQVADRLELSLETGPLLFRADDDRVYSWEERRAVEHAKSLLKSCGNLYLDLACEKVFVRLPEEAVAHRERLELWLDNRQLKLACTKTGRIELSDELLGTPGQGKYGLHKLELRCDQREVSSLWLLRVCCPFRECHGGTCWELPPDKRPYWTLERGSPFASLHASPLIKQPPGPPPYPPYHLVRFYNAPIAVSSGVYMLAIYFRGLAGKSFSINCTEFLEVVVPWGPGGKGIAYKELLDNEESAEHRFEERHIDLSDPDCWHRLVVIATVREEPSVRPSSVLCESYIDGEKVASKRIAFTRLPDGLVPFLKNYKSRLLSLRDFRVYRIPSALTGSLVVSSAHNTPTRAAADTASAIPPATYALSPEGTTWPASEAGQQYPPLVEDGRFVAQPVPLLSAGEAGGVARSCPQALGLGAASPQDLPPDVASTPSSH